MGENANDVARVRRLLELRYITFLHSHRFERTSTVYIGIRLTLAPFLGLSLKSRPLA
jgi:hypothetical protein